MDDQKCAHESKSALLTCDNAARMLGMSRRWFAGAVKRGEIPVVRLGRALRFDPRDIERFIESRKSKNRNAPGLVAGVSSHFSNAPGGKGQNNER